MYKVDMNLSEVLQLLQARASKVADDVINGRIESLEESLTALDALLAIVRAEKDKALSAIGERRGAIRRTCGQPHQQDSSLPQEP